MIPYHSGPEDVVHEVELGVILNDKDSSSSWLDRIGAYVLLLDMTNKVHLGSAIQGGTPWYKAKVQRGFLVLGDLIRKEEIADPYNVELELIINGEVRQKDITGNMNYKIDEMINYMEQEGSL